MKKNEVVYHLYKEINGCKVYQPLCNIDHKFNIELSNSETVCGQFENGKPVIHSVWKNYRNYFADRYISKYYQNETLIAIFDELIKEGF